MTLQWTKRERKNTFRTQWNQENQLLHNELGYNSTPLPIKSWGTMLHRSIVVGWVVTPTSLFALPGLFYWQPTARLFWYRVVLFLPPVESAQGAR